MSLARLPRAMKIAIKRRLLNDPDHAALEAAVTSHVVRLWQADITTFDPIIAARPEGGEQADRRLYRDYRLGTAGHRRAGSESLGLATIR